MHECNMKSKIRDSSEKKLLKDRLSRIEGQIRGLGKMIDNDVYCTDILIQVSAVTAALNSFNKKLLETHIRTCVTQDIKNDKTDSVEELVEVLQKLMK